MERKLTFVLLVVFALSAFQSQAQNRDNFYVVEGRRILLPDAERSRALSIAEGQMDEFRAAVADIPAVSLVPLPDLEDRYGVAFLSAPEGVDDEEFLEAVAALERQPAVESSVPVFHIDDLELVLVNEFVVRFGPDVPLETGRAVLERLGAEVLSMDERRSIFTISFPQEQPDAALRHVNELTEDPRVQYAQPSFVRVLAPRIGFVDELAGAPAARAAAFGIGGLTETDDEVLPACSTWLSAPAWSGPPHDELFPQQWALRNGATLASEGTAGADINAVEGWEGTQGSPDVTIAVLDLGVAPHPDLVAKMVPGEDLTNAGTTDPLSYDHHGTAVAGVAAASSNNGTGMTGVDWHSRVAPIRIAKAGCPAGDCRWGMLANAPALGVRAAIDRGARVLIGSWGWYADAPDNELNSAISEAVAEGAVVVFGAGQHRPAVDPIALQCSGAENRSVFYPARLAGDDDEARASGVIAVSATNRWDHFQVHECEDMQAPGVRSWGSSRGPEVSLSAPGADIVSLRNDGGYDCYFGTSMSAPLVGGAAALLFAKYSDATAAEVKRWLQEGADYLGSSPTGRDDRYGYGRLDIAGALAAAAEDRAPVPDEGEAGTPSSPHGLEALRVVTLPAILAFTALSLAWRLRSKRPK